MGYAPIAIPLYRSNAVSYIALMCVQAPLKMLEISRLFILQH
jgi:hypothetical protein